MASSGPHGRGGGDYLASHPLEGRTVLVQSILPGQRDHKELLQLAAQPVRRADRAHPQRKLSTSISSDCAAGG